MSILVTSVTSNNVIVLDQNVKNLKQRSVIWQWVSTSEVLLKVNFLSVLNKCKSRFKKEHLQPAFISSGIFCSRCLLILQCLYRDYPAKKKSKIS